MTDAEPCRLTIQVPLVRLERVCRSLEQALAATYAAPDLSIIWRRHVSADCPGCGILVCGEELRALAFPPCPELASVKLGRLRLGDCARAGCNSWHYDLHLWRQEGIDWPTLLTAAENLARPSHPSPRSSWLPGVRAFLAGYVPRLSAICCLLMALWLARQLYQGGRIPFFREPEEFRIETPVSSPDWPLPRDGSDKF